MATYRMRHRYGTRPDRVFDAADDADAIARARQIAVNRDYALRCGERCVAMIHHDAAPLLVSADPRLLWGGGARLNS